MFATVAGSPPVAIAQTRAAIALQDGWRFKQGIEPGDVATATFDDSGWARVSVPHTWNRVGNEGTERSPQSNTFRGPGWYRLRFPAPAGVRGKTCFLQFDGVGIVADVWLNGHYLGKHEGAFSRFRFDASAAINPDGPNLLVVKADNTRPEPGSVTDHVIPLSGDFFMFGGIYRDVSLIVTDPVHIDLADFGGPGVYGRTVRLDTAMATVSVVTRVTSDAAPSRKVAVQTRIEDMAGHVVASGERQMTAPVGATGTTESTLHIEHPRLWRGVADPYLYRIVVTLRSAKGAPLDEVVQPLGLRTVRFDPDKGFLLNGEPYKLVGTCMHQDRPGKGWAVSRADQAQDFELLREVGGTAVRLAHYQHDQYSYELADALGVVVWAEIPLVNQVSFDGSAASPALAGNARQQLTELIRQNFNHPSIAVWSVANEVDLRASQSTLRSKPRSLLEALTALAKQEDGSRPTTLADCCEVTPGSGSGAGQAAGEENRDIVVGVTDVLGYNRYFGWYRGRTEELGPYLDEAHKRHPRLPLAISEYGAGAALSQHSDNPAAGPINSHGRPHPEEYQTRFHEESWKQIRQRDYLWGVFIWNLFDFAVDTRSEGDLSDMNDKGLVSYDRSVRKDAFYFYKANWSDAPTLHLVGRRYLERPYGVVDVKAYSNAREAKLSVNGADIGASPCEGGICVWRAVHLEHGFNTVVAVADRNGTPLRDQLEWTYDGTPDVVRIKAGDISGFVTANGERYGSDNFFVGGEGHGVNPPDTPSDKPITVAGSDPVLYDSYREGSFAYEVPLPAGTYTVTAKFVEPVESSAGKRVFDVRANGNAVLTGLDIFAAAGGKLTAIDRSFNARVADGRLRLEFQPKTGQAVVSALSFVRAGD